MLVCAAVCPHPPVMVPELAAGAAPELDQLRATCDEAVRLVMESDPDLIVAVGSGPPGSGIREYASTSRPSFSRYGLELAGKPSEAGQLPLSLTIGAWLLQHSGWNGERCLLAVGGDVDSDTCRDTGKQLATRAGRVGLLVLGDGSARRTETGPGYLDARAASYDAGISRALAQGDWCGLCDLDAGVAEELLVAGRPAWQVMAGAAQDIDVEASLLADETPYGVAYFVAVWKVR